MSREVPCTHAASKWVGIVTDDINFKSPGSHMSVVTCAREKCIAASVAKVERFTRKTARLWTYDEIAALPSEARA